MWDEETATYLAYSNLNRYQNVILDSPAYTPPRKSMEALEADAAAAAVPEIKLGHSSSNGCISYLHPLFNARVERDQANPMLSYVILDYIITRDSQKRMEEN